MIRLSTAEARNIAKLDRRGRAADCLFVVQATRPQPLLAQLPTATYEAYNGWGGDSLYPGGADRVGRDPHHAGCRGLLRPSV